MRFAKEYALRSRRLPVLVFLRLDSHSKIQRPACARLSVSRPSRIRGTCASYCSSQQYASITHSRHLRVLLFIATYELNTASIPITFPPSIPPKTPQRPILPPSSPPPIQQIRAMADWLAKPENKDQWPNGFDPTNKEKDKRDAFVRHKCWVYN